jgi:mRNA interferase MazF
MTTVDRGAIVLVRFVFADESGAKRRPALILSTARFHAGRREVLVAAITSNVGRLLVGDHLIEGWHEVGLPLPSVVTGILRTVKRDMIDDKLGMLGGDDLAAVEHNLRVSLGL